MTLDTTFSTYTEDTGVLGRISVELQTHGVIVAADLQEELERDWNAPAIRRGRFVFLIEQPSTGLFTTVLVINGKFAEKSPFCMVRAGDGRYQILKDGDKYTEIFMLPRPEYYDMKTADGIPMSDIAVIGEPGHLRSVLNQRCGYQQLGLGCKFCAIESWWAGYMDKTPIHVAQVAEAAWKEGMARHITLSTGTKLTAGKGLEDLVAAARLIRERTDLTMTLNFEPLNDFTLLERLLREGKEAGATTVLCNIECFDEDLREGLMPLKGRNTIEDYMRVWDKCVAIFDHNEVHTMVIAGLGEDDESILRGVELAASMGVVVSIVPHTPMRHAAFEDMSPPSVARILHLYRMALPLYERYGLKLYGGTGGIYTSKKGM
jgi:biotin synthase-related radical SAM superfamily protein